MSEFRNIVRRTLIRENFEPEIDPELAQTAKLGLFALPKARKLPKQILEIDPNTEFEEEFENALRIHWKTGTALLPMEFVNYIKLAMKNEWYQNAFHEPDPSIDLYRGMRISLESFQSIFGLEATEHGQIDLNQSIPMKSIPTSWTIELDEAKAYATGRYSDNIFKTGVNLIMTTTSAKNQGKFWDSTVIKIVDHSDEILSLDKNIFIETVQWSIVKIKYGAELADELLKNS